jgi:hypothetical protein
MKKDNFKAINELKKMLDTTKSLTNRKLTLESFIMPEEEEGYEDGGTTAEEGFEDVPQREEPQNNSNEISGIEKELTQIRKIALSVINRLADQPTSPQYDTMKKIWNMVDKAIEQPQKGNGSYSE